VSEKLGIGDILTESFQFGLRQAPIIARVLWAPLLVLGVAAGGGGYVIGSQFADGVEPTRGLVALIAAFGAALLLGGPFLLGGAGAALYRLVALNEQPQGAFHIRFDGPAVRTALAWIIQSLITSAPFLIGAAIAFAGVKDLPPFQEFLEAFKLAQTDPEAAGPALVAWMGPIGLAFLIGFIPSVLLTVKLAAFAPGSAVRDTLFLFGSWRLNSGFFWSVLGGLIALMVAIILLSLVEGLAETVLRLIGGVIGGVAAKAFGGVAIALNVLFSLYTTAVGFAFNGAVYRRLTDVKHDA